MKQAKGTSAKDIWIKQVIPAVLLVLLVWLGVFSGIRAIIDSGITKGPDYVFGDQHLKTAVALIELYKTRYGHYPKKLSDINYTGQWDAMALGSVDYLPGSDLTSYYVEVNRGWMGKPEELQMPDEFWQGTGFNELLKE